MTSSINWNIGTFTPNKDKPIHRWYSYLEGYSSEFVSKIIEDETGIKSIYDPFCGSGTTSLVASNNNLISYYSETNPFMRRVIEAKTNSVKNLRDKGIYAENLILLKNKIKTIKKPTYTEINNWGGFEKFYSKKILNELLICKDAILQTQDRDTMNIALVLLSSLAVDASNMIRQGDLRKRKQTEKKTQIKNVLNSFIDKIDEATYDIEKSKYETLQYTHALNNDAKLVDEKNLVDCVITSPPYLNGTNYIRNTKLELKICDEIDNEKDLPKLHSKGVIAGINNVSSRVDVGEPINIIRPYINKLNKVSYDDRIQKMIIGYFNDMNTIIKNLSDIIKNNGSFYLDIGDSQFAGVHIPTHDILKQLCINNNFNFDTELILRKRRSKNNMELSQRLLKFSLDK